jgi:hypothetical protein
MPSFSGVQLGNWREDSVNTGARWKLNLTPDVSRTDGNKDPTQQSKHHIVLIPMLDQPTRPRRRHPPTTHTLLPVEKNVPRTPYKFYVGIKFLHKLRM